MTKKLTSILKDEGLEHLLNNFTDQGVTDSILGDLSDSDLKDLGVEKLGERKRLLAVFKGSSPSESAVAVTSQAVVTEPPASTTPTSAATPAEATKDSPFVNTLGMPFVPIPRFDTRFCIWPVRVQDYETYCMATGAVFPSCPFPQDGDHPIVGVTWNDASAFCAWLTKKEREEGKIDSDTAYRLPSDLEWSAAVGLPHEPESTPGDRDLKLTGYPWGLRWPPPKNAGNYEHDRIDQLSLKSKIQDFKELEQQQIENASSPMNSNSKSFILKCAREYKLKAEELTHQYINWKNWVPVDNFEFTSPVGSFSANQQGVFDLGGNVWEWCEDSWGPNHQNHKIARGGSYLFNIDNQGNVIPNEQAYSSSFRFAAEKTCFISNLSFNGQESINYPHGGFRVALTKVKSNYDQAKEFVIKNKSFFIHTNLFENNGQTNEKEFARLNEAWNKNDGNLLKIADACYANNQLGYAEALHRVMLESSSENIEFTDPNELVRWISNICDCMPESRNSEKIDLLKKYYEKGTLGATRLAYKYACVQCSAGNLDDAQILLSDHFNRDAYEIEQLGQGIEFALKDPDLLPIREFIQQIKNKRNLNSDKIKSIPSGNSDPATTTGLPSEESAPNKGIFSSFFRKK